MSNESRTKNIIDWVRWVFAVIVWVAENWETFPKPPSKGTIPESTANKSNA